MKFKFTYMNVISFSSRLLSPRTFLCHQIWSGNFRDYNSTQVLFDSDEDNLSRGTARDKIAQFMSGDLV